MASMAKGLPRRKCVLTSERVTRCTYTTTGPEHPHTEELPPHALQHDLRMYPGFESHSPWAAHASQRVSTSRQPPLRTRARAAGSATLLQPGPAAAAAHRAPLQPSTRAGRPGAACKGKQNDQVLCSQQARTPQRWTHRHTETPADHAAHSTMPGKGVATLRGDKICMSRRFDPYSLSAPLRFGLLHVAAKGADMDPLCRAPLLPFGDRAAAVQAALVQLAVGPQAAARSARSELAPGKAAAAKRNIVVRCWLCWHRKTMRTGGRSGLTSGPACLYTQNPHDRAACGHAVPLLCQAHQHLLTRSQPLAPRSGPPASLMRRGHLLRSAARL